MTNTPDETAARAVSLLRERAEQVLNAIDDGVYFLDSRGNTVFVNEAAARLLGYTAREMLGKPQHELIHHHYPDGTDFPREACPIYLSATEGIQQRVGGDVFWRKDGTSLHVDYTSIPIRERRQMVGVVVTFRDISAQQHAEEQESRLTKERAARAEAEVARQSLLISDQRYRALVEVARQYIWTNSPEGRMQGEQPGWSANLPRSTRGSGGRAPCIPTMRALPWKHGTTLSRPEACSPSSTVSVLSAASTGTSRFVLSPSSMRTAQSASGWGHIPTLPTSARR